MRNWSVPFLISICIVVFLTQCPVTLSRMTLDDAVPDKGRQGGAKGPSIHAMIRPDGCPRDQKRNLLGQCKDIL